MHKLRVGIIVDLNLLPTDGGTYSYYQSLLKGINNFNFDESIDIVNIVFYQQKKMHPDLTKPVVFIKTSFLSGFKRKTTSVFKKSTGYSLKSNLLVKCIANALNRNNTRAIEKQLAQNDIDIIYYLKPENNSLNYSCITTHWDIGHRTTHAFPELTTGSNYKNRENYYRYTLDKALLILCESDAGRQELLDHYNFSEKKVGVLPMFSNSALKPGSDEKANLRILADYHLEKEKFFIYPAQFWAHKNHYNLILAFEQLANKHKDIKLVLCGSDKGNLDHIKSIITELGLNNKVIITNFVSNEALSVFYTNAIALVMPTFLGPTNMPLIEAAQLKCPVLCSDFAGHREIMGDNALFFNPALPAEIENAMAQMITNKEKRNSMIESAYDHITRSKFNLDKSLVALNNLLLQVKSIRKTWGK
jgi:glycosyltransferase involved in cell wall biosynthesis